MSPITHLLISWSVSTAGDFSRKDRTLITLSGISPDIDGIGIIADLLTRHSENPLGWWEYHHILGHNIGFGILITTVVCLCAIRRAAAAILAFLTFHIHLICDMLGARGPDGDQWHIPYLLPFSNAWQLAWEGQWALNAPPNILITIMAMMFVFYMAWKQGISPLEMVSAEANQIFVETLRKRFER